MLYLENGNKLDINPSNLKILGSGAFGTVFKLNEETCLKINNYDHVHYLYDTITKEELLFKKNLIEKHMYIIKDNQYPNLCKIYELYYNTSKRLGGYTMQYLKKEYIDIEELDELYLLNSIINLINSAIILAHQYIQIRDANQYNAIMTREGVYLIDFDLYKYDPYLSINELEKINKQEIIKLFHNLTINNIICNGPNDYTINLLNLFNYEENNIDKVIENIINTLNNKKVLVK